MSSPYFRARAAAVAAILAGGAWLALLSCSSDPTNTLGSDSDLLGSEPGKVYQDTIAVFDDTTSAMHTPIAVGLTLEAGQDNFFNRAMIMQVGFSKLTETPGDTLRTVQSAYIHLTTGNLKDTFPVRFYELGHRYTEGDTVGSLSYLSAADAIVDTVAGSIERDLKAATQAYPIPASLAQRWIRDKDSREAIVIAFTGTDHRIVSIPSSEGDGVPYLHVAFTDGIQRSFNVADDATTYGPQSTTSDLVVSDGYPRRVFLRAAIDSLSKDSSVHAAHLRFHVVPNTFYAVREDSVARSLSVILYIPDNPDPASAGFKTGQRIIDINVASDQKEISFSLPNALFLILQGKLKNNGFAIRCTDENTNPRQLVLYGSAAPDSLRPKLYVTSSTPADFH
jgi:hypothetical protein